MVYRALYLCCFILFSQKSMSIIIFASNRQSEMRNSQVPAARASVIKSWNVPVGSATFHCFLSACHCETLLVEFSEGFKLKEEKMLVTLLLLSPMHY